MLKSSYRPSAVRRTSNNTKKCRALCSSKVHLKCSKVHLKCDAFLQGLTRSQHMKSETSAARSATHPPSRMQRSESQSSCVAETPRWDTSWKFEELSTKILKQSPFFVSLILPSFELVFVKQFWVKLGCTKVEVISVSTAGIAVLVLRRQSSRAAFTCPFV